MSQVPPLSFESAVDALGQKMVHGWKLGLERMEALADHLGVSQGRPTDYIHIAGTNGKGTTTCFIQEILRGQGYRSGGYFSPYVYSICERIQANGELISETDFAIVAHQVLTAVNQMDEEALGPVTEFECKTAMAFLYWKLKRSEIVALEVGLGGRLDATNIVVPLASVITSIGLDHQAFLGNTLAEIAFEKAGIIKPGIPVVVGKLPPPALDVVLKRAEVLGCPAWAFDRDIFVQPNGDTFAVVTPEGEFSGLSSRLIGSMVPHNAALAIAAVSMADKIRMPNQIASSVGGAFLPGRFEKVNVGGKSWVFDGSHNEEAAHVLASTWQQQFGDQRATLLSGLLAGHDVRPFYSALAPIVGTAHLVPIDFRRAKTPHELARELDGLFEQLVPHSDIRSAIESVGTGPVLVTGSFYLLGEVKRNLGIP